MGNNAPVKIRKPKKVICLRCFNEIEGEHLNCPTCGTRISKESKNLSFAIEDNKKQMFRSNEFLAKFIDVPERVVAQAVASYGYDGFKKTIKNNTVIDSIKVKGLFHYLSYSIDLHKDTSIVIAPNGYGKTTIFNLINFVLNPTPSLFNDSIKEIPFEQFVVKVNGKDIILEKDEQKEEFKYYIKGTKKAVIIPYYEVVDPRFKYEDRLYEALKKILELLVDAKIYSDIEFIKTNRVYPKQDKIDNPESNFVRRPAFHWDIPIIECSHVLANLMQEAKLKYQDLVSKTKDSLPEKFLSTSSIHHVNFKNFKVKWDKYYSYILHLTDFGLLDAPKGNNYINNLTEKQYNKILEEKGNFLAIYLDEYQKTLEPFYELDKKLTIFKEIIESRNYNHKTFYFHKNGFGFKRGKDNIGLNYLSSGEKNDIIMFFNLIFNTRDNSIILIDEPEISLHINWQLDYIKNIHKALANNKCQVIISTHSPEIISNNDKCLVKIKK